MVLFEKCQRVIIGLSIVATTAMTAHAQRDNVPTCDGWSTCNPGRPSCALVNEPPYEAPTVISDFSDGVSSDGRGPYIRDVDGVQRSWVVVGHANLALSFNKDSVRNPRTFTVNLNNPVRGAGGVPLGVITSASDNNLYTAWKRVGDAFVSMHEIPIGQTVTAQQMNVGFHINGRFHLLQMGPQPLGNCHVNANRVHGDGTSSGTIYRAGPTKWVIDLPAGSVGRLFDLSRTTENAVDRGLYYVRLHYEIGKEDAGPAQRR